MVSGLTPVAGASCASLLVPAIDPDDPQAGVLREESVASVLSAIGREPGTAGHRRDLGDHGRAVVQWGAERRLAQGSGRLHRRGGAGGRAAGTDPVARARARRRSAPRSRESTRTWRTSRRGRRCLPRSTGRCRRMEGFARPTRGRCRERGGSPVLREDHATAVARVRAAAGGLAAAQGHATEFAQSMSACPQTRTSWPACRAGVGAYRVALAALWPAAEAARTAIRAAADAEAELADSRQLLLAASERAAEARETADAAATTYEELLATVGTAVEELQRQLAEATGALGRNKTARAPPATGNGTRSERAARRTGNAGGCGRTSRMQRGSGTTRCASSRRSRPPGCCGSR